MSSPCFACLYRPPGQDDQPVEPSLVSIAEAFSPRYERHTDDLITIDVSGLDRLFGTPQEIADEVRRAAAAAGRVHVAVAGTRTTALILALARPGVSVVGAGHEAAALAPVPLGVLNQAASALHMGSGAGSRSRSDSGAEADRGSVPTEVFHRWGLRTFGDLAALPPADLVARLGAASREWQALARGEDTRPLVPTLAEERFESSLALEWPIEGLEPLSFVITRLLEPLSIRLERRDRGAAVLHVMLQLVTRATHTRRLQLPSPMRDVRTLRTLALLDLESHPPDAAIDRVTIVIDPTPGRVLQHTLFTRAHPTPERLSTLLARLTALMGHDRLGAPATIDSYRPGAFAMKPFATEHAYDDHRGPRRARRDAVGQPSANPQLSSHSDDRHRDETIGGAPLGSADSAGSALYVVTAMNVVVTALRRCRQPVPARVAVEHGRPVRVTTDRRGFAGGSVTMSSGPWRTSGAWWAGSSETWHRDEWDVHLSDGAAYRIFQDRETEGWFVDAIVD